MPRDKDGRAPAAHQGSAVQRQHLWHGLWLRAGIIVKYLVLLGLAVEVLPGPSVWKLHN